MGAPPRDGAPGGVRSDALAARPDNLRDAAGAAKRDGASEPAPVRPDGGAPDLLADACVPLVCAEPTCFPAYCGEIGDGCGATLRCGGCSAGWSCKGGQCFPDDCTPMTCDNPTPFPYCGTIGNGCGGTLACSCPNPAWVCVGRVCNALPSGCVPIPGCVNPWGDEYCGGLIGDGCGGVLDCRRECSRSGFVCQSNVCVDPRDGGPPAGPAPPPTLPPPPPVAPPPPPPPCPPPAPDPGGE